MFISTPKCREGKYANRLSYQGRGKGNCWSEFGVAMSSRRREGRSTLDENVRKAEQATMAAGKSGSMQWRAECRVVELRIEGKL